MDPVAPLYLRAMGVVVEVEVPDEPTRARLAEQWSRAVVARPADGPDTGAVAYPARPGDEESTDYAFTTQVTVAALNATTGRRLNLHAGGLADDSGRVLALVAPSGTGKTTATRVLAERLGYVSDETVSVDPRGVVRPHPKPLSVVVDPARQFHKVQVSPDLLGLLPTPETGRLRRLVVLRRGGPGPSGLSVLDPVTGLLELVQQSSSLSQLPRPLTTVLELAAACGGVRLLQYDEIADHADELVALLSVEPAPEETVLDRVVQLDVVGTDLLSEVSGPSEAGGELLGRMSYVDAVLVGPRVVVLSGARAWLLADITATVWLHLDKPRTMDELVAEAERHHGEHPDAAEIVAEAVATLHEEGLLLYGTLA